MIRRKTMRNKARRSLALILSVAMTVTLWKTPVYAVMESGQSDTGLCEHHTVHTEDCGYTEETPCRYVCEICNSQNGGENEQQPDTEDSAQKECSCTIRCTEGKVNTECPICGAEGADLSVCKGTQENEQQPDTEAGAQESVASVTATDGTEKFYSSFNEAWAAAIENQGSTLTLQRDVELVEEYGNLSVDGGNFTLDLNNKTLKRCASGELIFVSGSANITIQNGKLVSTSEDGNGSTLHIYGGTVVLDKVELTNQGERALALGMEGGKLTVKDCGFFGTFWVDYSSNAHPELEVANTTLHSGIRLVFKNSGNPDYDAVKAIFAEGNWLHDQSEKAIDITKEEYWVNLWGMSQFEYSGKCLIKPHTHNFENGSCPCGETCVASVTADGTEIFYSSFDEAWAAAIENQGSTLTLQCDVELAKENHGPSVSEGTFTLDLNGKTLKQNAFAELLEVSDTANITIQNGKLVNTLNMDSSSVGSSDGVALKINNGTVVLDGVELTSGTGDEGKKSFALEMEGGNLTVTGSTFKGGLSVKYSLDGHPELKVANTTLHNGIGLGFFGSGNPDYDAVRAIFAEGNWLHDQSGKAIDITKEDCWKTAESISAFYYPGECQIVPHTHNFENGSCPCGETRVASVTGDGETTYYTEIQNALAQAEGKTVKLLKPVSGAVTIDKALTLDLNGQNIESLTVNAKATIKDSGTTKGIIGTLKISDNLKPKDLTENGYAIKKGNGDWFTYGTQATNATVQQVPIKSVTITKDKDSYRPGEQITLTATAETLDGKEVNHYIWVQDGSMMEMPPATPEQPNPPTNVHTLTAKGGTHTYQCVAYCEDYGFASNTITITVDQINLVDNAELVVEQLTYNGQPQTPDVVVKLNGETLKGCYDLQRTLETNAGTYTLSVTGTGNYTGTIKKEWKIDPAELTVNLPKTYEKQYDGTAAVDIKPTFSGLQGEETLTSEDFTVTASFNDATPGENKPLDITVNLVENAKTKNYKLKNGTAHINGTITKAPLNSEGYAYADQSIEIVNKQIDTYEFEMSSFLPKLDEGKTYGTVTYSNLKVDISGYYSLIPKEAEIINGKLSLPIVYNNTEKTGSVGEVSVQVDSTNYDSFTLIIDVNAKNKIAPVVTAPVANTLTYNGEEQTLVTAGTTSIGTMFYGVGELDDFEWSEQLPTAKNAGTYTVWYQVEGNKEYADVEPQSVDVTIAKKAVTVTALDKSAYTGSDAPDLSNPEANKDYKVEGLLDADALNCKVTLTYEQTPDMNKAGTTAIIATSTLSKDNYEITYLPGTLTVSMKPSSGGNGDTSSGSSSSNNRDDSVGNQTTSTQRPDEDRPNIPAEKQNKKLKADSKGNVTITKSDLSDAIKAAKNDAKKQGNRKNGIAVKIPMELNQKLDGAQITLKADMIDTLVRKRVKSFTIGTDQMMDLGFTLDTIKELNRQTNGDIILKMKKSTVSSGEAKSAIGNRPVYDISLWTVKNNKEIRLTDLNKKSIRIAIPYVPAKGEQTGNLYALSVDAAGKVQRITKSSYDADQKAVIFYVDQPGIYGIGYDAKGANFTDIANHWAKDNILFAVSRGLLSGTSETTFSPDDAMTKGMFIAALGRLAGVDPAGYQTGTFTDVKADADYAPYVNWAVSKGIVDGTSDTTFSPDSSITREQMAVIMKNYAAKLGYAVPKTLEAATFADNENISSWAKKAVKSMQQAGVLAGKTNNRFDPKGTATRAEVAAVLRRFVEIDIDPQTANGWTQNDSGEWSYYKNGKQVKDGLSNNKK